jgi:hypothetical protein
MPTETPGKLTARMEIVIRLHQLAATQQPQLHSPISQLDSSSLNSLSTLTRNVRCHQSVILNFSQCKTPTHIMNTLLEGPLGIHYRQVLLDIYFSIA